MLKVDDWGSVQYGAKAKFSRAASGGWSTRVAGAAVGVVEAGANVTAAVAPSCSRAALPRSSASRASASVRRSPPWRTWARLWPPLRVGGGTADPPIPRTKPPQSMRRRKRPTAAGANLRTRADALAAPLPTPDGLPLLTRWASFSASTIPRRTPVTGETSRSPPETLSRTVYGPGSLSAAPKARDRSRRPAGIRRAIRGGDGEGSMSSPRRVRGRSGGRSVLPAASTPSTPG